MIVKMTQSEEIGDDEFLDEMQQIGTIGKTMRLLGSRNAFWPTIRHSMHPYARLV
jgi:hypothetical protein